MTSYAIQLLAWGMGDAMAKYLPEKEFNWFGWKWSLNPGPWNAKEHALIVVAYWGSVSYVNSSLRYAFPFNSPKREAGRTTDGR